MPKKLKLLRQKCNVILSMFAVPVLLGNLKFNINLSHKFSKTAVSGVMR